MAHIHPLHDFSLNSKKQPFKSLLKVSMYNIRKNDMLNTGTKFK